jgi:hypothetical protein
MSSTKRSTSSPQAKPTLADKGPLQVFSIRLHSRLQRVVFTASSAADLYAPSQLSLFVFSPVHRCAEFRGGSSRFASSTSIPRAPSNSRPVFCAKAMEQLGRDAIYFDYFTATSGLDEKLPRFTMWPRDKRRLAGARMR